MEKIPNKLWDIDELYSTSMNEDSTMWGKTFAQICGELTSQNGQITSLKDGDFWSILNENTTLDYYKKNRQTNFFL